MGEVLIKGAKIPKSCGSCPLALHDEELKENEIICNVLLRTRDVDFRASILSADGKYWFLYNRHANCPLVELPEPHGALKDEMYVINEIDRQFGGNERTSDIAQDIQGIIMSAPTILEASE